MTMDMFTPVQQQQLAVNFNVLIFTLS